jgi:hypothetical protein
MKQINLFKERGVCTMEKKMTKKEMFTSIVKGIDTYLIEFDDDRFNSDMVSFLQHEIELLDKKSANKKPTKTQEANEGLKDIILTVLTSEGMTASEVLASADEFNGLSNQKISTLLNQLVKDGKIEKVTDSRKSIFKAL